MKNTKSVRAIAISALIVRRSKNFRLQIAKLNVKAGAVACIVGANGSGKTTLIESVVGLLHPDAGSIRIYGKSMSNADIEARKLLGYIPDDEGWIIPELTAHEYLMLIGQIYNYQDNHLTHELEIARLAKKLLFTSFSQQLGNLSHGNKKKVQIMAALLYRPKVLVVDELRNGLDPIAIKKAEELLAEYARKGNTVLAATHDLWWAQRFANEIIMLKEGRILLQGNKTTLVEEAGSLENKFFELYRDDA